MPTFWPIFEPTLLVNMLANMLARFAIETNMLGKKKNVEKCWPTLLAKLTCWHGLLWTWPTTYLANILDFERLFESNWLTDGSD